MVNSKYWRYIQQLDIGSLPSQKALPYPTLVSTNLMTKLRHRMNNDMIDTNCDGAFDVLYLTVAKKYYLFGTLIVIYIPDKVRKDFGPDFYCTSRRITFTYLKQKNRSFFFHQKETETYSLMTLSNGCKVRLWDTPYLLEAVTAYDKEFRKEWEGEWLAYEGNQYGDKM